MYCQLLNLQSFIYFLILDPLCFVWEWKWSKWPICRNLRWNSDLIYSNFERLHCTSGAIQLELLIIERLIYLVFFYKNESTIILIKGLKISNYSTLVTHVHELDFHLTVMWNALRQLRFVLILSRLCIPNSLLDEYSITLFWVLFLQYVYWIYNALNDHIFNLKFELM